MGHPVSRRAALLGLGAAAVSGCSFEPVDFNPPSDSPTPTESQDPAKEVDGEYFLRSRDGDAKNLPEGDYGSVVISTPHFDATLQGWFVGERLSLETAAQVGETTPLKAPPGHELAAVTLKGGLPAYVETADHSVTSALTVGSNRIPLPSLFEKFNPGSGSYLTEWEMLVFTVLPDDQITLEVTDEGRTVKVDLRTGMPVADEDWNANLGFRERWDITCTPETGTFNRAFSTTPPPELQPQSGSVVVTLRPDGELLPWTPILGWAPEGQQWLVAAMNARVQVGGEVFGQQNINVPQSFTYQDAAGQKIPAAHPETVTTDALARGQVDLMVIWPVSGHDASGVLGFNPTGPIEVDYTDHANVPAEFTAQAQPLEFILEYQPRPRAN